MLLSLGKLVATLWAAEAFFVVVVLGAVVAIAAGDRTSYALTPDGHVWAWGDNASGELGKLVEGFTRAIDVHQVQERLARLEETMKR